MSGEQRVAQQLQMLRSLGIEEGQEQGFPEPLPEARKMFKR
jgi:EAL domain-containing protein (putative c-di-GMP-specific phosphodiesterase class I)